MTHEADGCATHRERRDEADNGSDEKGRHMKDEPANTVRVECNEPLSDFALDDRKQWRGQEDERVFQERRAGARAMLLLQRVRTLREMSDFFGDD